MKYILHCAKLEKFLFFKQRKAFFTNYPGTHYVLRCAKRHTVNAAFE